MKKYLLVLLCAISSLTALAQSGRFVNGVVFDENDSPMAGVKVVAKGGAEQFVTGSDGQFNMTVSVYTKYLEAYAEGYLTQSAEIDGSYIVFRMKIDKKYAEQKEAAEKAAKEAAIAKAKAEEQARIEAEKKAAADAVAKAKAEEQARVAAEKEAAAKAKAEEQARIEAEKKAEAERMAAQKAAAKAKRIAQRNEIDKAYNAKYRNRGLVHSFELSYGYQSGKEDVIYKNLGYREYGNFHPIEATYTIGYRFCNWVSLGLGAGVAYNLVNLCTYGDLFDPMYQGADKFTPINIPIFLNTTVYMSRGKCQPMFSVSGGVYAPNQEVLADVGIGCNLRLSKKGNMYFLASIRTTPYGFFVENSLSDSYYFSDFVWTPSFKIGFTF